MKCICQDCGKLFKKGDECDNEKFCLRCCHQSLIFNMDEVDYDEYDRSSYDSERIEIQRSEA